MSDLITRNILSLSNTIHVIALAVLFVAWYAWRIDCRLVAVENVHRAVPTEGFNAFLRTCRSDTGAGDACIGENTGTGSFAQHMNNAQETARINRLGKESFFGNAEPPVFYNIGDYRENVVRQKQTAADIKGDEDAQYDIKWKGHDEQGRPLSYRVKSYNDDGSFDGHYKWVNREQYCKILADSDRVSPFCYNSEGATFDPTLSLLSQS